MRKICVFCIAFKMFGPDCTRSMFIQPVYTALRHYKREELCVWLHKVFNSIRIHMQIQCKKMLYKHKHTQHFPVEHANDLALDLVVFLLYFLIFFVLKCKHTVDLTSSMPWHMPAFRIFLRIISALFLLVYILPMHRKPPFKRP